MFLNKYECLEDSKIYVCGINLGMKGSSYSSVPLRLHSISCKCKWIQTFLASTVTGTPLFMTRTFKFLFTWRKKRTI